ncbi:MAG: gas vesicle protein [Chloroflexi bacterium]|nr:gas vesicle protein [Chloroflexota bacterium]
MEAVSTRHATLVDLLDRVLDRGLVINTDIIITLAGVPLVALSIRAAIASIDTMEKSGFMIGWDRSIRSGSTGDSTQQQ